MQPRRTTGAILVAFCLLWVSPATGLPGDKPEVATPPPQALLLWQQGYALTPISNSSRALSIQNIPQKF